MHIKCLHVGTLTEEKTNCCRYGMMMMMMHSRDLMHWRRQQVEKTYQKHLPRNCVRLPAGDAVIPEAAGPCSLCRPACVSIYLTWLPLSMTFPLQLLPAALCGHTTGGASVVKLMQYPSSSRSRTAAFSPRSSVQVEFLQTNSKFHTQCV